MRDRSAETAVRCASLLFSRRAGKDCGLPAGDPPPFSFAGGKRKRPRPVKRKPLGRKGGPNGPPFRERGGRANRSGGRRRPRRPCARPVPQEAASPHNYCGGRMGVQGGIGVFLLPRVPLRYALPGYLKELPTVACCRNGLWHGTGPKASPRGSGAGAV